MGISSANLLSSAVDTRSNVGRRLSLKHARIRTPHQYLRRRKLSVSFSSDVPDNPKKQCQRAREGTSTFSPEHKDQLWWNQDSLAESRYKARESVFAHLNGRSSYTKAIIFLMNSYKKESMTRQDLVLSIRTVRKSDVRGLEQRIVPVLKVCRKISMKTVVGLQLKLREAQNTTVDENTEIIGSQSQQASRSARQLAYRLAQADRLEANRIYKEEDMMPR